MSPEEAALREKIRKLKRTRSARNTHIREIEQRLDKVYEEVEAIDVEIKKAELELLRQPTLSVLHGRMLQRLSRCESPAPLNVANAQPLVDMKYIEKKSAYSAHLAGYTITEEGRARLQKEYPDGKVPGVTYTAASPWVEG